MSDSSSASGSRSQVTDVTSAVQTVTLTIDGKEITVPKGTLVIRAAEQLGTTIPRFCDHPLLDPVGACRQCMVEIEGQRKPFTSCTTECGDGMVVRTHMTSDFAADAQRAQLEFLLLNHPLDCPQCDKGGECPLQDQTLAHGPPDTRMIDEKRRYPKPVPISAQVALDRERCVLCARCTRFSQQISGDPFIELFERGALEQVAIYSDEPYHSYYSGNVVQICPVGALTATSYRFAARPFDLKTYHGVCNQCSAGCNLRIDVRRGEVQRQLAADNMAVNEMWNCDKGRFGYEFVGAVERLVEPAIRTGLGSFKAAGWPTAVQRAAEAFRSAIEAGGPAAVGVLTGGRLTDEDAYALSRFTRDVLGTDNLDFRMAPRTEDEHGVLAAVSGTTGPTYDDVEHADVVVIAGLDPEEEVPILHLRLRKASRARRQRIVVVGPHLGSLDGIAWRWVRTGAGEEAAVLDGLARDEAPGGLDDVAEALRTGKVVVLAGERLALSPGALPAAAGMARERGFGFAWVPRRNNARGAVDAGLLPGVLPGGHTLAEAGPVAQAWLGVPAEQGLDTRGILEGAAAGTIKVLYLVGVDPLRDFEDPGLAAAALAKAETVIVQDILPTDTLRHADIVLPAMAPQERVGSFTTWEGRRQPFERAVPARGFAQEDWDIIGQLARALDRDLGWETAAAVRREAAPLMATGVSALSRFGSGTSAPVGGAHPAAPAPETPFRSPPPQDAPASDAPSAPAVSAGGSFGLVVRDLLVGEGTMLLGAKALKATARRPSAWINETDARRIGIEQGQHVAVRGPGGTAELPAHVTTAVAAGTVVVPGPSAVGQVAGVPGGTPRVSVEPLASWTITERGA